MKLHDYTWEVKSSVLRRIYFLGDLHVGNASFDEKNCRAVINAIRDDDDGRFFFMGDGAECITPKDKRWDFESIDPKFHQSISHLPQAQVNYLCDLLAPIKSKCIGYHAGNHELKIRDRNQDYDPMFDYHALFAKEAENLGTDIAITRIRFIDAPRIDALNIYTTHGYGYATTVGGKLNNLLRLADSFPNCDIYARGHCHDCGVHSEPALDVPKRGKMRLDERLRLFIATGCYFKTYTVGHSSYGARRAYRATQLGTPYVELSYPTINNRKKLRMNFGVIP